MKSAFIEFSLNGKSYVYDGGMPHELDDMIAPYLDDDGFWTGRPAAFTQKAADEFDDLPDSLWEIEKIGGQVIRIVGQRPNGAIHWGDWINGRIY